MDNNCDGLFDLHSTINWTGLSGDNQWSNPKNWDQKIVPLSCQFVVIPTDDNVIVDGVFACKGVDIGPNATLTILDGNYLNIDSKDDNLVMPATIKGLLNVNGKIQVK